MNLQFTLYHYWRSSSSWRVRWALHLKQIPCHYVAVDLLSGEADLPEHRKRNPSGYVPVLKISGPQNSQPTYLSESLAIIEWLEELVPQPSLVPGSGLQKARVRQLAEIINAGTQPIQNPNVAAYYSADPDQQKTWNQHWIRQGLSTYETWVKETSGKFSVGNSLTLADLCLVPQCYNALRYDVRLEEFPTIHSIYQAAFQTESAQATAPEKFKPSTS